MEHLTIESARRFLRGQLPAAEAAQWQRHLAACERCRTLLAEEQTWSRVLDLPNEPTAAPATVPAALLEQIERGRQGRSLVGVGIATAALGCVVLVGLLIWQMAASLHAANTRAADGDEPAALLWRLNELETLRADPWIIGQYAVVETLVAFVQDQPTTTQE